MAVPGLTWLTLVGIVVMSGAIDQSLVPDRDDVALVPFGRDQAVGEPDRSGSWATARRGDGRRDDDLGYGARLADRSRVR